MIDIFFVCRIYFVAAALGAHSNFQAEGFRQRDLRFLLGLFLNWMDSTTRGLDESVHNTQVSRYLNQLIKNGYAERTGRAASPRYVLTRVGLLEMVSQLTKVPVLAPIEQFFFVQMFVRTYGERLKEMVKAKDMKMPRAYQVELESRLDHRELITQQIRAIQLELRKLEERTREVKGAFELSQKLFKQGVSVNKVIEAVGERHPYDLNSQKPMADLFYEVPPELRSWELTVGNENRLKFLWAPLNKYLTNYLDQLKALAD